MCLILFNGYFYDEIYIIYSQINHVKVFDSEQMINK